MKTVLVERDPKYRKRELFRIVWAYDDGERRLREGGLDRQTADEWAEQDRRNARRAQRGRRARTAQARMQ